MSLTVEKCLQAWTNSLKQMNVKVDIVFLGDSLIFYGNFSQLFPGKKVCNLGLRGDTLEGIKNRIEQVRLLEPQQVFLMGGINDLANTTEELFQNRYESLIRMLLQSVPSTNLVIQSLLPVNTLCFGPISCDNSMIVKANIIIEELARINGCEFINLYRIYERNGQLPDIDTFDGIHLKPGSMSRWYHAIECLYSL